MKISYSWLKQFIQTDQTPQELSLILTNIGLEVESLETVQAVAGGLEGLVIGHVLSCVQHPNADRLRVTTVDVGGPEILQIVCGAPNVAQGQKVVVATVGTTVYPNEGEPFKINKSKIRGEVSEGMICAEDEIGLGISHDGIMVLPEDAQVGTPAKVYFKLEDDFLYEIGLTPNRADAASHLGVARDLAAYFRTDIRMPDISGFKADEESLLIDVKVEDTAAAPRYSSVTISGVTVKASPDWLQNKLKVIGIRPINNIVDITNYVLHDLGVPLHAFDADQIKGAKVIVKKCAAGTPFVTLDGVERKLSAEDLMICNAEEPMCIAGVFGGKSSGISDTTTNIFLESAYFNAVSVRKTSKRHSLKTDASFRFERGTDPDMTVVALKRAALLIAELGNGKISSPVSDIYPEPVKPYEVDVNYSNINRLIGAEIPAEEIKAIIIALGIHVAAETADGLSLKVPAFKVDVTRECDITEEVLRIYGYNNIEIPSKINASLSYSSKPDKEQTQHVIADMLTANGFLEIWCNSLTKGAYSKAPDEAVQILNPLSSDLNVMRQELLMPALESVAYNQNRKTADIKFYEFGKTYHLIAGKYVERPRLLILLSGNNQAEQWNQKPAPVSFYHLKAAVDAVIGRLGIATYQLEEVKDERFAFGLRYFRGDKTLVSFGAATAADKKKADVDKDVYYADFDWALLLDLVRKNKIVNKEVPKYPAVRRDLSMLVDTDVTFDTLKSIAFKTEKKLIRNVQVFDVYIGDKLPAGKKSYALNFTLQDEEQTLTDKQIDAVMQKIMHNLAQTVNAEIRK
ncbi:phenylalanine--tRNA ligase subunit beta [Pedobacter heparinus]|uniref:Phenylalanine--tRNA ligase beta subunit n=1 Tax=Pedobacter heparinus (strain ATCC 13125 / DSM 2366 / CIP 104194 / JCM 7457 / NBRC 12017 / NCIMB 9290 / NRRL B-14731 / HIM 762-3) TaxID=485917 RepID=C6Y254_PEDHD|nr:phenylalanine--tRNA ligase subunit beta [Pedobacter heparinus]ACU03047.1 phenylalanyl-tRNA synthetase, beta subunit [Pedobacter heparinus DSM 2366]